MSSKTVHLLAQMLTGLDAAARSEAVTRLVELENEHKELLGERETTYRNLMHAYVKLMEADHERKLLREELERHEELESLYRKQLANYTTLNRRHTRKPPKEETNPVDRRCKLSPEQVAEIRQFYDTYKPSMSELAKRFGRSKSHVWNIVHGHYWKPTPGMCAMPKRSS